MSATFKINGGDEENRTPDPLLARQVLSQLSYAPIMVCILFLKVVPSKLDNATFIQMNDLNSQVR